MGESTCSTSKCRRKRYCRGLCTYHYGVAYREGTRPAVQLELKLVTTHSISNADVEGRVGDCDICGPGIKLRVRYRKNGKAHVECRPGSRGGVGPHTRMDRIRWKYGLSVDQYEVLVQEQAGRCPICRQEPEQLVVDHCHKTGAVRGLLCRGCNLGIGFMKDDAASLRRAIAYLER